MEGKNTVRLGRRAMLAATLGGVAAAAGALAAPGKVLGADGDPLRIGQENSGAHRTRLQCTDETMAFLAQGTAGHGVEGTTNAGSGRAGVYGLAYQPGSTGVVGLNDASLTGGSLGSGTAGVRAAQGNGALALEVMGKAHFSRSGKATIQSGKRFVQIGVDGLTDSSFALATLLQLRDNLWVQSITVSASSAAIYIYTNRKAPADTRVAWAVFD